MSEEIESTQVTPSEAAETAEGATSAEGRGGRKPESAYRQLQSERDRAAASAQQAQQQLQNTMARMQQMERQMQETALRAQLSQLPEDEANKRLAAYQWNQVQQQLSESQQRAQQAERERMALENNTGRIVAAMEMMVQHGLPEKVHGIPTAQFLITHGGMDPAEMKRIAEELAVDFGGKAKTASTAKAAGTKQAHSRYAGDGGPSAPRKPLSERPREERKEIFDRLIRGEINNDDILAGRV